MQEDTMKRQDTSYGASMGQIWGKYGSDAADAWNRYASDGDPSNLLPVIGDRLRKMGPDLVKTLYTFALVFAQK